MQRHVHDLLDLSGDSGLIAMGEWKQPIPRSGMQLQAELSRHAKGLECERSTMSFPPPDKNGRIQHVAEILANLCNDMGYLQGFHAGLHDRPAETFCIVAERLARQGYRTWLGEYFNVYWRFLSDEGRRAVAEDFCERLVNCMDLTDVPDKR
jgi:hypothetical protein